MFQTSPKKSYYFNIGVCALFGIVYFILGVVFILIDLSSVDPDDIGIGIAISAVGGLILLFATIAFLGKRVGVILLIIIHIGNPITMIAAFQALRYLNEYGEYEVDIIGRKRAKKKANYYHLKEMKEKYDNEPKLD